MTPTPGVPLGGIPAVAHCPRRRRRRPSHSSGPDSTGQGLACCQLCVCCSDSICDGGPHCWVWGALAPLLDGCDPNTTHHLNATSPCSDRWSRWWFGDTGKPGVSASSSSDAGKCPFGASREGHEEESQDISGAVTGSFLKDTASPSSTGALDLQTSSDQEAGWASAAFCH